MSAQRHNNFFHTFPEPDLTPLAQPNPVHIVSRDVEQYISPRTSKSMSAGRSEECLGQLLYKIVASYSARQSEQTPRFDAAEAPLISSCCGLLSP